MTKLTKGELQDIAEEKGLDPDKSYEELREVLDIKECKQCGDEYIYGWHIDGFCSESCEIRYKQD